MEATVEPRPRPEWDVLAAIALGGGVGSLARWGLAVAWQPAAGAFPWPTFVVNMLGSFLLGLLLVLVHDQRANRYTRPFLGVGVLGGFTTFSAYMLELRNLLAADRPTLALTYVVATLLVGLLAVFAGLRLGRAIARAKSKAR